MKSLLPLLLLVGLLVLPAPALSADSYAPANSANVLIDEHGACYRVTNNTGDQIFVPTKSAAEWTAFRNNASGVTLSACTYGWVTGGWSACSANPSWSSWSACSKSCGGGTQTRTCQNTSGTQTRTVTCKRMDGSTVADALCGGAKPATSQGCTGSCSGSSSQSCNTQSCCGGITVGGYCWYISASGGSCDAACASHGGTSLTGTRNYAGSGGTASQCNAVFVAHGYSSSPADSGTCTGAYGCMRSTSNPSASNVRCYNLDTTGSAVAGGFARACACNN